VRTRPKLEVEVFSGKIGLLNKKNENRLSSKFTRYRALLGINSFIFIARQHAIHAERDIVLANLSVCPSHSGIVSKRTHITLSTFW